MGAGGIFYVSAGNLPGSSDAGTWQGAKLDLFPIAAIVFSVYYIENNNFPGAFPEPDGEGSGILKKINVF
jgi:hypothetical protein